MKIAVIGSGGREHALIDALSRSPSTEALFCIPGNAGIAAQAECVSLADNAAIVQWCVGEAIDLVVVGPEAPLVEGLADNLRAKDIATLGPSQAAAVIEGSKAFMKECAVKYGIPTASHASFNLEAEALAYVQQQQAPIVVKTDGLAAGKGVIIAQTTEEAEEAVRSMFGGRFGSAGATVVVEDFLEGEELSVFALCDGKTAIAFGAAQDHKRVGEGDTGPNTGGMGTYTPPPLLDDALHTRIMDELITPLIEGLKKDNIPYNGFLFAGVMVSPAGEPILLEYNVRMGDPETQVILPLLQSDAATLFYDAAVGNLTGKQAEFSDQAALCVVLASAGYPGAYEKGSEIMHINDAEALDGVKIFHAGTKQKDGKIIAVGGRVLGVTAVANTVEEAQQQAYKAVDAIAWPEGFCRRDIGYRAIGRQGKEDRGQKKEKHYA